MDFFQFVTWAINIFAVYYIYENFPISDIESKS